MPAAHLLNARLAMLAHGPSLSSTKTNLRLQPNSVGQWPSSLYDLKLLPYSSPTWTTLIALCDAFRQGQTSLRGMPPSISFPALRAVHMGRFQRDAGAFSHLGALAGTTVAQGSLILGVKPTIVVEVVRRLMLTPHGDGSLVEWMQIELPVQHIAEARCDCCISRVVLHLWKGPARVRLRVGHSKQISWYEATQGSSTSLPDDMLPEGCLERDVLSTSIIVLDFEADSDDVDRLLNELYRFTKVYVHGTRRGGLPQEDCGPPQRAAARDDDTSAASQQNQQVADAQRRVARPRCGVRKPNAVKHRAPMARGVPSAARHPRKAVERSSAPSVMPPSREVVVTVPTSLCGPPTPPHAAASAPIRDVTQAVAAPTSDQSLMAAFLGLVQLR